MAYDILLYNISRESNGEEVWEVKRLIACLFIHLKGLKFNSFFLPC